MRTPCADLPQPAEVAAPDARFDRIGPSAELAELQPALVRLDLRLRLAVEAFRSELAERARDPFRGLYISEADVDELLAAAPPAELARTLLDGPPGPVPPRLRRLAQLLGLDSFDQETLLICMAPDVDLRYERLYGYLQDDTTRRRPTVDLVLRLLTPSSLDASVQARAALGPAGRLLRTGLVTAATGPETSGQGSLLARELRVDERIVAYLLGSDWPDPRLAPSCQLFRVDGAMWPPGPEDDGPGLQCGVDQGHRAPPMEPRADLVRLLATSIGEQAVPCLGPVVYLQGPPGSGKQAAARAACAAAGRTLMLLDLPALLAASSDHAAPATLACAVREALLQDAVLGVDGFHRVLVEDGDLAQLRAAVHRTLAACRGPVLLLGEAHWEPALWFGGRVALRVELAVLGPGARARLWHARLDGRVAAEEVAELAARYRLVDDDAIRAVVASATSRAALRGEAHAAGPDLRAAARAIAAPPLEALARRVEPRYVWHDIVLPTDGLAQLRELCARARHQEVVLERWGFGRKHVRRAGLTALFVGPPGTGKTMAAEIVAGELGLDLYRIDLSAVVSKYVGETEKNLEKVFRAADQGDAVLLFDEADALFGKRSEVRDAHDRYANVEVAYLLQRLETYEGIAILTTNLRANIDDAFVRRLDCLLEFPMPEEAERLAIWQRALPDGAPLAADADLPFLARKFKLAGGHIRNVAVTAAFLAAADRTSIGMQHLVRGTRREYQKLGKLIAETDFGRYYELLKDG